MRRGGTVTLAVNGVAETVTYGKSGIVGSPVIASALIAAINGDRASSVTATSTGSIISLTSKTGGAASNYPSRPRNPDLRDDPMLLQWKLDHARRLSTIMRTKAGSALPSTATTVPPGSSIRIEPATVTSVRRLRRRCCWSGMASRCRARPCASGWSTGLSTVASPARCWSSSTTRPAG